MHPLDLVKVQQQVSVSRSRSGQPGALKAIYRSVVHIGHEGGLRGLYRGLTPNLVGNASSWGLYFLWYTMIKNRMSEKNGEGGKGKLGAGQHLLASAESGECGSFLWVGGSCGNLFG